MTPIGRLPHNAAVFRSVVHGVQVHHHTVVPRLRPAGLSVLSYAYRRADVFPLNVHLHVSDGIQRTHELHFPATFGSCPRQCADTDPAPVDDIGHHLATRNGLSAQQTEEVRPEASRLLRRLYATRKDLKTDLLVA